VGVAPAAEFAAEAAMTSTPHVLDPRIDARPALFAAV
jgi:hypothetical protein